MENTTEIGFVELESLDAPGWASFWTGVGVGVGIVALVAT